MMLGETSGFDQSVLCCLDFELRFKEYQHNNNCLQLSVFAAEYQFKTGAWRLWKLCRSGPLKLRLGLGV